MTANGNGDGPENRSRLPVGKVIALISIVIALIFIAQNSESGAVSFLFWDFTLPTWVWAAGLFLLGGVAGYSFHWSRTRARRKARRND
jgi:uncharacterized integral membrane protein